MKAGGASQASQPCCSREISTMLPDPLAWPCICLVASVSLGQTTGRSTEKASYYHGACFPSVFEVDKCFYSVAERALCGHDCGNCWRLSPRPARCWGQLLLCLYTKVSSWEWGRLEVTPSSSRIPWILLSRIPRIPLWDGVYFLNCSMKVV